MPKYHNSLCVLKSKEHVYKLKEMLKQTLADGNGYIRGNASLYPNGTVEGPWQGNPH